MEKLSLYAAAIPLLPIGNITIAVLMTCKSKVINLFSILIGYICTLILMALFVFCSGLPMLYFGWLALVSLVVIGLLILPTYLHLDLFKKLIKTGDKKVDCKLIIICTFFAVMIDCIVWSVVWSFYAYFDELWIVLLLNVIHFAALSLQSVPLSMKMTNSKLRDKIVFLVGGSGLSAMIFVNVLGALLSAKINYHEIAGLISQFSIHLIICRVVSFVLPYLAVLCALYLICKKRNMSKL